MTRPSVKRVKKMICGAGLRALALLLFLPLAEAAPNVLLISVDTLRADHLGCYGSKIKTPAFDALAARSVVFEQAISQVPLTLPSHISILTGLYPDQHGVRNNENFALPPGVFTLAELFRAHGYATGAVVGSFSLDSGFGLNQGFQYYDDRMGQGDDPSANRYVERRAAAVWKLGHEWITQQKQPWFCFLHFFDPHTGYNPPPPFPSTYDGEIAYVDSVLEEILQYLNATGAYSNTVVVLLSDHGESLGEHGEASHGVFLYDATLHVPLMVAAPGIKPGRVREQVRLVDVAPTLAELAGLSDNNFRPSGQSLLDVIRGKGQDRPAYSESFYTNLLLGWAPLQSVRWSGKKWIQAPKPELYDLAGDPQELKNVYTPSSVPVTMQRELARHSGKPQHPPVVENADPELKEKLASLGYVTGGSTTVSHSGFDPKDGIAQWARIETAVTAAQTGDLETSKKLFEEVLVAQPDNVLAHKFLANVLRKNGDLAGATTHLRAALKSELHRNETRYDLAEVLYEQGQYAESLDLLQQVLNEEPVQKRAIKLAGLAAIKAKQYEKAAGYLAKAVENNPADDEALSEQARVMSYLQQDEAAMKLYLQLERLRSLREDECVQVAALYLTRRDGASAEKYFRQALAVNADSIPAWKGIGLILASRQQWSDALDAFLKGKDCSAARNVVFQDRSLPKEKVEAFRRQCP
ncbi:MAG TPA: sulfatase-like hydrolase/transferase [Acidobacteriota bacterium]|nr:sulfatase-like hydrolase/transferase [Acidobacteriota bacterium]